MAPFLRTVFVVSSLSCISSVSLAANEKSAPAHAAPAHAASGHAVRGGGVSHVGRPAAPAHAFHGHSFHGRVAWEKGKWHHENRHGRNGWWYDVDGAEYYYDQPQYPYPSDVSQVEFVDQNTAPPPMTCAQATKVAPEARAQSDQLAAEIRSRARNTSFAQSFLTGMTGSRDTRNTCSLQTPLLEAYSNELAALQGCPKLDNSNRRSDLEKLLALQQDSIDYCNGSPEE
jgi:hypothetical protein